MIKNRYQQLVLSPEWAQGLRMKLEPPVDFRRVSLQELGEIIKVSREAGLNPETADYLQGWMASVAKNNIADRLM